ncbi:MAG: hypothetical protein AMJ95_02885 [Omnitrophica WOR_2 bacterium SM23_72]|nr:MAG: hypothetical protein AMJ95_02885 [Omnitrophica WOR_2 bacterium SM23_72]
MSFTLVFAQSVSSEDLIKNAWEYDGKTVVYEGEVIGDIMRRKEFAWVNVKEGKSAIGIWVPHALLQDVAYSGSYKSKGDTVKVRGIFHRACPEHGGDLDIHAEALSVTSRGRTVTERMNLDKRNTAVMLLGALCLVWISSLFIRK